MFRKIGLLALLAGPVAAEPADCPRLAAALREVSGYQVTAPPAGPEGGWCVFDRAVLTSNTGPDIAADRLRLRGEMAEGALVDLALEAGGVRIAPGLGQRDLDPVLRESFRLQTAEISGALAGGPEGLRLRGGWLRLSGGTELSVEADVAGAGLSAGSFVLGRLTWARLDWRNDGRLLRPVMESWGERLVDGVGGGKAVDAARLALQHVVMNLPDSLFPGDTRDRLEDVLDALPQGRGRLVLEFRTDAGIGAAQVGIAVLSGDPLAPEPLARFLAGATVTVDWQPGLAP